MKRFALAVVLSVSITHFAVAQHHAEGGSSSSSSGSSGGSSSGGGYSGGYSGGSSSGASHSSGGGGYSGGSHSSGGSGNSGGYSGGGSSHSGGSHSGASSHSGGSSSPSAGGANSHLRGGNSSARSNMRSSTNSAEQSDNHNGAIRGGGNFANGYSAVSGSILRQPTASGEPWMDKPYTLDISAANLSRALSHHEFDSKLQAQGLESNKSAYRDRLAALGIKAPEVHRPNWIARMFGAKATSAQPGASSQLRPCLAKECKPIPVPPKPCAGEKCPAPPPVPVPTPITGVCANGYDSYGYCLPWGYVSRCNTYGNYCYVRFARVDPNYCGRILQQIRREQANYRQVEQQQQSACAAGPQSQECTQATQKLQKLGKGIFQLEHQYQLCQTATGWTTADPSWSTGTVAAPEWPSDAWPYFPPLF